jgi:hypothetical protein
MFGRIFNDIRNGVPPSTKPRDFGANADPLWSIIELCWKRNPKDRVRARELIVTLRAYTSVLIPQAPTKVSEVAPISSTEPDIAMNDQYKSAGEKLPFPATSTGPFQETYNIIRELEGRWGPNSPTSFSDEDAAQIHGLFDRFQGNQKELKSLLRYSGNKVEFIRTAIEMFLHLMRHRRGFIAEYDPSSDQEPSQLLKDHLIVKLSGKSRYMTSPCGRFEGRSRCIHCSENRNNGKIRKKRWRNWQHVIICLSVFIQGRQNVWYCFELGW